MMLTSISIRQSSRALLSRKSGLAPVIPSPPLSSKTKCMPSLKRFSDKARITRNTNKVVSSEERTALRQARKQRATTAKQQQQQQQISQQQSTSTASSSTGGASSTTAGKRPYDPRLVFGLGLAVPTLLLAWGVYDEDSPPAKFASLLGFDEVFDSFAKPHEDKLLPNWHDVSVSNFCQGFSCTWSLYTKLSIVLTLCILIYVYVYIHMY